MRAYFDSDILIWHLRGEEKARGFFSRISKNKEYQWHPSHGIDINDAILAATVKINGGKVYTLNVKHFPMVDIIIEKPW